MNKITEAVKGLGQAFKKANKAVRSFGRAVPKIKCERHRLAGNAKRWKRAGYNRGMILAGKLNHRRQGNES